MYNIAMTTKEIAFAVGHPLAEKIKITGVE